ncbi:MAG: SUF system NifU family Fe-S cluster assembly protein [Erysipelotrichaceae bacterium]|nr:SUF system NifU family Fe-S cluster assembly protein [Erysipelotrichaceae bacterium]MBQ4570791.1 SUF system NifU family Fe-S cluster assembly protein [Bacilli bacterium]
MAGISDLYNQVLKDHRNYPRNKGLIDGYKTLKVKNPSCGDDVTVQLNIENGIIKDVRHIGTGCAICCSSASVMSETLKGKSVKVANEIIEDFYELIKGNYPDDEDRLGDAIVYVNIHNYPPRAKCATLAWRAAGAIIHGDEGETIDE